MWYIVAIMDQQLNEHYFYVGRCNFEKAKKKASDLLKNNLRTFIKSLDCVDHVSFWYQCGRRNLPISPPKRYAHAYALGQLITWKP